MLTLIRTYYDRMTALRISQVVESTRHPMDGDMSASRDAA